MSFLSEKKGAWQEPKTIAYGFPCVLIIVDSLLWAGGFSRGHDRCRCSVQLEGIYWESPGEIWDNILPLL